MISKTYYVKSPNRNNRVFLNIVYSFVFIALVALITFSFDPVEKIDPVLKKHVTVLNIVQENIKSGFREPLISDLEYIVPALAEYSFTTKDYYKAVRFNKNNSNIVKGKNGFFYIKKAR